MKQGSGTLEIQGACTGRGHSELELQYELIVARTGPSGTSRTRQSGTFIPGSPTADTLSRNSVSYDPGDSLFVQLKIFAGDEIVGKKEVRRDLR